MDDCRWRAQLGKQEVPVIENPGDLIPERCKVSSGNIRYLQGSLVRSPQARPSVISASQVPVVGNTSSGCAQLMGFPGERRMMTNVCTLCKLIGGDCSLLLSLAQNTHSPRHCHLLFPEGPWTLKTGQDSWYPPPKGSSGWEPQRNRHPVQRQVPGRSVDPVSFLLHLLSSWQVARRLVGLDERHRAQARVGQQGGFPRCRANIKALFFCTDMCNSLVGLITRTETDSWVPAGRNQTQRRAVLSWQRCKSLMGKPPGPKSIVWTDGHGCLGESWWLPYLFPGKIRKGCRANNGGKCAAFSREFICFP